MFHQLKDDAFLAGLVVVFCCSLWAQHPNADQRTESAIKRVKSLQVSALDGSLPNVSLEFFLNYEADGAPIQWSLSSCSQPGANARSENLPDAPVCVRAEIDQKNDGSATVLIGLGKPRRRPIPVPWVVSVKVTHPNGAVQEIPRLGLLPMELNRPLPRVIRDLPAPGDGAVAGLHNGFANT